VGEEDGVEEPEDLEDYDYVSTKWRCAWDVEVGEKK